MSQMGKNVIALVANLHNLTLVCSAAHAEFTFKLNGDEQPQHVGKRRVSNFTCRQHEKITFFTHCRLERHVYPMRVSNTRSGISFFRLIYVQKRSVFNSRVCPEVEQFVCAK